MAKVPARYAPYISQAQMEALVRFGPQLSGLNALRNQALNSFALTSHQADAGAANVRNAVKAAIPQLTGVYDKAIPSNEALSRGLVSSDLANLPGVSPSIRAAMALEGATATSNLNSAKTAAVTGLANQGTQAQAGATVAKNNAAMVLGQALQQIGGRSTDLAGEQGAFTTGEVQNLINQARDRGVKIQLGKLDAGAVIGAAQAREQGTITAAKIRAASGGGGSKAPVINVAGTPVKVQAAAAHAKLDSQVQLGIQQAKDLIRKGQSPQAAFSLLVKGRPAQTIYYDPKTHNPVAKGTVGAASTTLPAIKAVPGLAARAALDIATKGGVSLQTHQSLNRQGYLLRQLGYKALKPPTAAQKRAQQVQGYARQIRAAVP